MGNNEWRGILLNSLVFPSELYSLLATPGCLDMNVSATHPFQSCLGRHVAGQILLENNV